MLRSGEPDDRDRLGSRLCSADAMIETLNLLRVQTSNDGGLFSGRKGFNDRRDQAIFTNTPRAM